MKAGWTLVDVDEMDIHFYFEVMKEETTSTVKRGFIDQVL